MSRRRNILARITPITRSRRRGVVAVIAMMFLILFGSLAAAMAITSKGNIVTAATHQHVSRALGAAETGMAVAAQRLDEAARRFVVERGDVDPGFGWRLWTGAFLGGDGQITIEPPTSYPDPFAPPTGLVEAVAQIHSQDANTVVVYGIAEPTIGPAPPDTDPAEYQMDFWLRTPAVALTAQGAGKPANTAFQIDYAPLAAGNEVRVIVTGFDFDYAAGGQPVTRTIMQDFRLTKRVNAAVMSPSRIMIGKNVMVEGDMGAMYTDVGKDFGDPLIMKSDFYGIDAGLDDKLDKLFAALRDYDVDLDNRLRVGHPIEGPGIPDFNGDGTPDGAAADVTQDGYVDEFDVFILHFDKNKDGKVVLSKALTLGTPAEGLDPEFVDASGDEIDDDLGLLVDSAFPDRNRNGVWGFIDNNGNNRFDPGVDELLDFEEVDVDDIPPALKSYVVYSGSTAIVYSDQVLGYRDGVIDRRDQYAKVAGRLVFRVKQSEWTAAQGDYMQRLRGPIVPEPGASPMYFDAGPSELPSLTGASFTNSQTALKDAADGKSFDEQVAANLGVSLADLLAWTPDKNPPDPEAAKYYPLQPDGDGDGLPDNWETAYWEKMPFNSPSFSEFYYRPVYENMIFHNVRIPEGNNGLFRGCTFVGVTYVRSRIDNSHPNWTIYGKLRLDGETGKPTLEPPRYVYGDDPDETSFPPMLLEPQHHPVLMATSPLDKGDVPEDKISYTLGYNLLPDPLIINGTRIIDTTTLSNNIRYHDCLFVGSIVSDAPQDYTNVRNKFQFTGATRFEPKHPKYPEDPYYNPKPEHLAEIAKSTMMLPNYSVDIGSFNSPKEQNVHLRGAIVAGVLDVRGNALIEGALLLTFEPILGQTPLVNAQGPIGNPALFNATLGYFGPEDGDDESLDPETLPLYNGVKIVGWDLDGDGLADLPPEQQPTPEQFAAGAAAVPFHGYGAITLRFDPDMALPDGIMLPVEIDRRGSTYREARR